MLVVANLANTNDAKNLLKMTENLAYMYSSESTQSELSNEYLHGRFRWFSKYWHPFAFDESSLSIGRVKRYVRAMRALNYLAINNTLKLLLLINTYLRYRK